jgi:hypothetical protein
MKLILLKIIYVRKLPHNVCVGGGDIVWVGAVKIIGGKGGEKIMYIANVNHGVCIPSHVLILGPLWCRQNHWRQRWGKNSVHRECKSCQNPPILL